jgi:translation initiation factor IF-1
VAKEETIMTMGVVEEVLPNAVFRVMLSDSDHVITAYLGGKLRQNRIRVLTGDRVEIEMSPYDLNRGRIIYRNK